MREPTRDHTTDRSETAVRHSSRHSSQRDRHDDDRSDVDDQFRSLLEGLRTSLPGVQVLFAFLLTVPLQGGFADFDNVERAAFTIAFFSSGIASVLLIAPSVHQRMRAPMTGIRRHSKAHLAISTWVTIVGTISMGLAVATTVFLVTKLEFASMPAAIATAAMSVLVAWSWFYLPLVTFVRVDPGPPSEADH